MAYQYVQASRASEKHALPDVEVFYWSAPEIADAEAVDGDGEPLAPGWYYANLDGGLDCWSGDPSGPYATEAEALAAAREDAGLCAHGMGDDETCAACPAPILWVIEREPGVYLHWSWGSALSAPCGAWGSEECARIQAEKMADAGLLIGHWSIVRLPDDLARRWGRDSEGK